MPYWILAALIFCLSAAANAAGSCAKKYDLREGCYCDAELNRLPIPAPAGFTLYAVCGMTDIKDGTEINLKTARDLAPGQFDTGSYFYQGTQTLTGSIVKSDDLALGDTVVFYPDHRAPSATSKRKLSRLQGFSQLRSISLIANEKIIGTENLVTSEKISWCAQATITLKKVEIFVADTEGEGPIAHELEVVSRSKFRKC